MSEHQSTSTRERRGDHGGEAERRWALGGLRHQGPQTLPPLPLMSLLRRVSDDPNAPALLPLVAHQLRTLQATGGNQYVQRVVKNGTRLQRISSTPAVVNAVSHHVTVRRVERPGAAGPGEPRWHAAKDKKTKTGVMAAYVARARYSQPGATYIQRSPGIPETLQKKYKVGLVTGDKEWSKPDLDTLRSTLAKLGREAPLLRGYTFVRWSSTENRAKTDKTYKQPSREEAGEHDIDLDKGILKIHLYDSAFGGGPIKDVLGKKLASASLSPKQVILHEIGHAVESAGERRAFELYKKTHEKDAKAVERHNKGIDAYNEAVKAYNMIMAERNTVYEGFQNDWKPFVEKWNAASREERTTLKPKLAEFKKAKRQYGLEYATLTKKLKGAEKRKNSAKRAKDEAERAAGRAREALGKAEAKLDASKGRILREFEKIAEAKRITTPYSKEEGAVEQFAEAFALFKVAPRQLKKGYPALYRFFLKSKHLK